MADPAFVARMSDDTPRSPTVAVLSVLWFVTAPLVSLLFGLAVLAATTAAVLAVVAGVTVRRRQKRRRPANGDDRR